MGVGAVVQELGASRREWRFFISGASEFGRVSLFRIEESKVKGSGFGVLGLDLASQLEFWRFGTWGGGLQVSVR